MLSIGVLRLWRRLHLGGDVPFLNLVIRSLESSIISELIGCL